MVGGFPCSCVFTACFLFIYFFSFFAAAGGGWKRIEPAVPKSRCCAMPGEAAGCSWREKEASSKLNLRSGWLATRL